MATATPNRKSDRQTRILPPVFYPSVVLIAAIVALTASFPETAAGLFSRLNAWIIDSFGWFYSLSVTGFLAVAIVLAASRYGAIRLGPDDSRPDYSFASWFAMLFSAGMGIGLLFFSVAEPLTHFRAPPSGEGGTAGAARLAMEVTYFHWGIHAWAVYAIVGLILAYFGFRHRLPLAIRSALYPLIGERVHGPIGHAVDIFAVMGTLFGVATSLGFGVTQVNAGLNELFDIRVGTDIQILLIAAITAAATVSVVSGLDRGIRRLSEANLGLALVLLVFVMLTGPTLLLVNAYVENLGNYVQTLVARSLMLKVYAGDDGWLGRWTIFYWGWWISWSPFVGMFIARISRGRTIREFLLGVLLVPSLLSFMWFTVFGNGALFLELAGQGADIAAAVEGDLPRALFAFLGHLPLADITSFLALVLVITFFVTSSDSGSLVIDIITAGGKTGTPVWQRVFWATAEGAVAAVLLLAGGLAALQTAALTSALPFALIIIVAIFGLWRGLAMEGMRMRSTGHPPGVVPAPSPAGWRKRLNAMLSFPSRGQVEAFVNETVVPALAEVAREIEDHDCGASARLSADGRELRVHHGEEPDFLFAIRIKGYLKPGFAFPEFDPDALDREGNGGERYYRAEVHLAEGGQDHDIYGYSKDQVIYEVLDRYNRHMQFLHLVQA